VSIRPERERERLLDPNRMEMIDISQKLAAVDDKAQKAKATPAAAAPVAPAEPPPVIATSTFRGPLLVIVVGAGGTGARVVPPLTQMLRRGDSVAIIDHDIVEDRNLLRQHFAARDIGRPKAAVLAERYRKDGIALGSFQTRLTPENANDTLGAVYNALCVAPGQPGRAVAGVVVIGCVDNAAARRGMQALNTCHPNIGAPEGAWIDVGNEMRGGQVLLTLNSWPLKAAGAVSFPPSRCQMNTIGQAMPQLLRDRPDETESCGERIDLQTVQVNHMASSMVINTLSWLMLGIPFTSAGMFFSTLNTTSPIKILGGSAGRLNVETRHAL
jgi:hypothetical protein